jgi:hypothetical protein
MSSSPCCRQPTIVPKQIGGPLPTSPTFGPGGPDRTGALRGGVILEAVPVLSDRYLPITGKAR